MFSVAAYLVTI